MKRLNFDVDDEFHAKLKAYCARRGVDMKEEVVELLSLVLEAQAEPPKGEEREPYGSEAVEPVEPEGATEEKPKWEREYEEYKRKYGEGGNASPPFLRKTEEGESSGDVNERFRKIEAEIKTLWERATYLLNYINERTEKLKELTETVEHIEKWLERTYGET